MILDKIFIHLRKTGATGTYLASRVFNWYGKLFIGAPKPEDIPGPDDSVKQRISETYFNIPTERMPAKRNANWEISQLWSAQLRDEEEKQVGIAAYIYPIVISMVLLAAGGGTHKLMTSPDSWWQKRQAEVAAQEAVEYKQKSEKLIEKWTTQAQSYSAKKCVDEAGTLRVRKEREDQDHYSAIEKGCQARIAEIRQIGSTMTVKKCEQFGNEMAADKARGGSPTWADELVWNNGCMRQHPEQLRDIDIRNGGVHITMPKYPMPD